ncbi:hypothetical protein L6164_030882 [Bauhinia variegata]|uniref:Uncharacterized protein n=1 Tax=Bauhinia variegata TaxID=167791 RepID=A0ACB9LDV1_BAUVA|nr:hypothetical protein L6164_030882 [Bauhinia variegata]
MATIAHDVDIIFQQPSGVDFGPVVFDQAVEEAQRGVKIHAQTLLQIKDLLESIVERSTKGIKRELVSAQSLLKKDIYTIIQSKPGTERPQPRKLYLE